MYAIRSYYVRAAEGEDAVTLREREAAATPNSGRTWPAILVPVLAAMIGTGAAAQPAPEPAPAVETAAVAPSGAGNASASTPPTASPVPTPGSTDDESLVPKPALVGIQVDVRPTRNNFV